MLSPFTVEGARTNGYLPERDTTGSRLNTSLKDVAASITVFTPEMMQDLNAINLEQALDYAPNVEFMERNAGANDLNTIPMRIRGLEIQSVPTADFFPVWDNIDVYKTERIGFSRGPNAILFGIGDPGGVVTSTTKQAKLDRRAFELSSQFDNWGSWRGNLDVNQPLLTNRAALRVSLLKQHQTGAMKPQYKDDTRIFLTGKGVLLDRPNFRTILRGYYEWIDGDDLIPMYTRSSDNVSNWIAAGRPTSSTPMPSVLPAGTARDGTSQLIFVTGDSNSSIPITRWQNMLRGTGTGQLMQTEAIIPFDLNVKGASDPAPRKIQQSALFLEQQLGRDFFLEGAYFYGSRERRWAVKSTINVFVDANQTLPDGRPNPNVGKLYTQHNGTTDDQLSDRTGYRLTGAYKFDFARLNPSLGKWLGWHQAFGLYEHADYWSAYERLQVVNTTPLPGAPTSLANSANQITFRNYLDGNAGYPDYRRPIVRDGVTAMAMPVLANSASANRNDSYVFAMMNHFWKDRIVTTIGWRQDDTVTYSSNPVTDARGLQQLGREQSVTKDLSQSFRPASRGVVVRPFPWLAFTYNYSENSAGAAASAKDPYGNNLPSTAGKGTDYGIRFDLLRDKLSVMFNRYNSARVYASDTFDDANNVNLIWQALNRSDLLMPASPATKDTFDNASKGWESSLTYNPTSNWRIFASVSNNESIQSNVHPASNAYLAQYMPEWQRSPGITASDGRTIGTIINEIQNKEAQRNGRSGLPEYNLRKWNGSLVTNYTFSKGLLRGASIGGSALYRGSAITGVFIDSTGFVHLDQPFTQPAYWTLNTNVAYSMRLKQHYTWRTQLSLGNVLNYGGNLIITSNNNNGTASGIRWVPGMSATLTTSLKF